MIRRHFRPLNNDRMCPAGKQLLTLALLVVLISSSNDGQIGDSTVEFVLMTSACQVSLD